MIDNYTDNQISIQVGLMGKAKAEAFLLSLLQMVRGNVSAVARTMSEGGEHPVAPMSQAEAKENDQKAIKDWNAVEETPEDRVHAFMKDHPGQSGASLREVLGLTSNQWTYIVKKLT